MTTITAFSGESKLVEVLVRACVAGLGAPDVSSAGVVKMEASSSWSASPTKITAFSGASCSREAMYASRAIGIVYRAAAESAGPAMEVGRTSATADIGFLSIDSIVCN